MKITKFKKATKIIITCALIQSSFMPLASASDAMDKAEQIIEAHRQLSREKALVAVNEDFNFALSETLNGLMKKPNLADAKKNLFVSQEEILKGLNDLVNLKTTDTERLKEQAFAAFDKYTSYVQKRYDISYIPADTKQEMRSSLLVASQSLANFERNCASGRGIGGLNNHNFSYPSLPRSDYEFKIGYSDSSGYSASGSGTFSGSSAEKSRNEVANISLGATSMVASIAYSGSTGAAIAACQAAAPFMMAGGAVIALGVMYLNQVERVKMQNEIVDAEMHAFHNTADDRDVAKFYVNSCKSISVESQKIRKILNTALNSPSELSSLYHDDGHDWENEMQGIATLLKKRDDVYTETLVLLDQNKKSPTEELKKKIQEHVDELKKLDAELKKNFTAEKVANLMISFLLKQEDEFKTSMESALWKSVELTQKKAFEKVLSLILLLQKRNFQKFLNQDDDFGLEAQAAAKVLEAKKAFKNVLTLQIKGVFGRVERAEIAAAEGDLKVKTKFILNKYGRSNEVIDFARQVRDLIGSAWSK